MRMTPELFSDDRLRDKSIDALKRYLRSKLAGYTVAMKYIRTDNLLYRGVPWQQRPSKIDDVSYPPADKAKLGRANRPGKPMFYCSRAMPSVFYELRANEGEFIALSEWEVVEPLWMHNVGYHPDALQKLGAPDHPLRLPLADPIPDEFRKNARLRAQLSLAFTEDVREGWEYRYKQSIAINELLFDGASPIPRTSGRPKI